MNLGKERIRFVAVVLIAHTIGYLFAGGIAYQFITKEIWAGEDPLLSAYLRTPGDAELWKAAMLWQIPGQLLRGLLMGLVLLPVCNSAKEWGAWKKFLFFSSLLVVFTHLAASAPSPANIEGLVYMRPEFVAQGFAIMQPEMIMYGIIAGLVFTRFAYKRRQTNKTSAAMLKMQTLKY